MRPNVNTKGWACVEGNGIQEYCPMYNLENTVKRLNCRNVKIRLLTKTKYKFADEK